MPPRYGHLRRYGTRKKQDEVTVVEVRGDGLVAARGKLWDLRTGEAKGGDRGFYASSDGRSCAYAEGGTLVAVHADGSRVPLSFPETPSALQSGAVFWVGDFLVARDQHGKPWLVLNARTGGAVGRLSGQTRDEPVGYWPSVFDPQDGETLIFCNGKGLQRVRVRDAHVEDVLGAPDGVRFIGAVGTSRGDWVLIERPEVVPNDRHDTARDAVVARDAQGVERARLAAGSPPFQIRRLGERVLLTDGAGFAVLDDDLHEVARAPFVDDDSFARTIPLPSGREWIAIGGFSQWDHYGDVTLAPPESPAPAAKKKAAVPKKK
jgi:hypothetical protein